MKKHHFNVYVPEGYAPTRADVSAFETSMAFALNRYFETQGKIEVVYADTFDSEDEK